MMIPQSKTQHIDDALQMHLTSLHDAFIDLLSAFLSIILALLAVLHSCTRLLYATIGLAVWSLGLWIVLLTAFRNDLARHAQMSIYHEEAKREEEASNANS